MLCDAIACCYGDQIYLILLAFARSCHMQSLGLSFEKDQNLCLDEAYLAHFYVLLSPPGGWPLKKIPTKIALISSILEL